MLSKLDQLRTMTIIVANTGDIDAVRRLKPVDCTTNPTLLLKAVQTPLGGEILTEAIRWAGGKPGNAQARSAAVCDRMAVAIGRKLSEVVLGRVSTEVDADLSFDTKGTVEKAREIIAAHASFGVPRERILIKVASTWEGRPRSSNYRA